MTSTREAIVALHNAGFTRREIAHKLNFSEQNVRKHLKAAGLGMGRGVDARRRPA